MDFGARVCRHPRWRHACPSSRGSVGAAASKLSLSNDGDLLVTMPGAYPAGGVICTVTSSPIPIVKGEWLRPGTHINMVGAHTPSTREVDTEAVKRSRLFVETRSAALAEAGDILMPLNADDINESHILGELAELVLGVVEPRENKADITAYKSLGNIVQDLAVSHQVVQRIRNNADQSNQ